MKEEGGQGRKRQIFIWSIVPSTQVGRGTRKERSIEKGRKRTRNEGRSKDDLNRRLFFLISRLGKDGQSVPARS